MNREQVTVNRELSWITANCFAPGIEAESPEYLRSKYEDLERIARPGARIF